MQLHADAVKRRVQENLDRRSRFPFGATSAPSIKDWLALMHAAPLAILLSYLARPDPTSAALSHASYATLLATAHLPAEDTQAAGALALACADSSSAQLLPEHALLTSFQNLLSEPSTGAVLATAVPVATGMPAPSLCSEELTNPTCSNAWAIAMVQAMLRQPFLDGSPCTAYLGIAAHSAALSRTLLPLLFATAATTIPGDAPGHEGTSSAAAQLRTDLSRLLSQYVLPPIPTATALLQAHPRGSAAVSSNGSIPSPLVPLPLARIEVMQLVLQCLAMLRACNVAARLEPRCTRKHRHARHADVEAAQLVLGWRTDFWLDLDCLQARWRADTVHAMSHTDHFSGLRCMKHGMLLCSICLFQGLGMILTALRCRCQWPCYGNIDTNSTICRTNCIQVAAAAALCGRHEEAVKYMEAWSAAITLHGRLPSPPELVAFQKKQVQNGPKPAIDLLATASNAWGAELELRPEEAVLWSCFRALEDADLSYGLASTLKVHSLTAWDLLCWL
jgi:hypothetical protein